MLIVSLATSDMLIGIFVMSFAVYFEWTDFRWNLGEKLCNFYLAIDVTCSTASILNLFIISLDRYIAISHPILYAQFGTRNHRALISIFLVWFISISVGLPILFGANPLENQVSFSLNFPISIAINVFTLSNRISLYLKMITIKFLISF